MSNANIRAYAVALPCTRVIYLSAPGQRAEHPWDPSVTIPEASAALGADSITAQNAAVARMLGVGSLQQIYGAAENEPLAGSGVGSPLYIICNLPSNPLGLAGPFPYVPTADDHAVAEYVEYNGAPLYEHLATFLPAPPVASPAPTTPVAGAVQVPAPAAAPAPPAPIASGPVLLLLNRFKVTVTFKHTQVVMGQTETLTGQGTAVALPQTNGGSGYFWFFDPTKADLMVGVVSAGDAGWGFFAGGLTNVGCALTATDAKTGASHTWNAPDNIPFQPIQDWGGVFKAP